VWTRSRRYGLVVTTSWLPADFDYPARVELPTGHHLRPIRADDVALDMVAVMGSRERLWSIFGEVWRWPPADMTVAEDRADLERHEREMAARASFDYALFDADESALLGCVYIDPPTKVGADADVSWWVVDELVDSPLDAALTALVPSWIRRDWPFSSPRFISTAAGWATWMALPDLPADGTSFHT